MTQSCPVQKARRAEVGTPCSASCYSGALIKPGSLSNSHTLTISESVAA